MNLPGPIKSLTELTILRLPVLKLEMCFLLIRNVEALDALIDKW